MPCFVSVAFPQAFPEEPCKEGPCHTGRLVSPWLLPRPPGALVIEEQPLQMLRGREPNLHSLCSGEGRGCPPSGPHPQSHSSGVRVHFCFRHFLPVTVVSPLSHSDWFHGSVCCGFVYFRGHSPWQVSSRVRRLKVGLVLKVWEVP